MNLKMLALGGVAAVGLYFILKDDQMSQKEQTDCLKNAVDELVKSTVNVPKDIRAGYAPTYRAMGLHGVADCLEADEVTVSCQETMTTAFMERFQTAPPDQLRMLALSMKSLPNPKAQEAAKCLEEVAQAREK